jgi:hypothetical protein
VQRLLYQHAVILLRRLGLGLGLLLPRQLCASSARYAANAQRTPQRRALILAAAAAAAAAASERRCGEEDLPSGRRTLRSGVVGLAVRQPKSTGLIEVGANEAHRFLWIAVRNHPRAAQHAVGNAFAE